MTETEARAALDAWVQKRREVDAQRDTLVRAVHEAGITKHQIHVVTGIARTTINRILSSGGH